MDRVRSRSGTLVLEYSPEMSTDTGAARSPAGTLALEYSPPSSDEAAGAIAFDYSAATLLQDDPHHPTTAAVLAPPREIPSTPLATRTHRTEELSGLLPALLQLLRERRLGLGAGLVAALVLASVVQHTGRRHASDTAMPPPALSSAKTAGPSAPATEMVAAAGPVGKNLSGIWRGEYIDASGRQLLRVVSLRITRVQQDGGIEGTLRYVSASGGGECELHPRGSSYRADAQRLQLSPEACTPHYPKELGVPLDFVGVNPRTDTLDEGRIEAPSGEVIKVNLTRVSGAAATSDSPPQNAA